MSALATLGGTALSLAALGWLAANDPKRRRAFDLAAHPGPRRAGVAWTLAFLPGLLVPFWSGGAGLVLWLGAVSVAGWVLAAVSPDRSAAWLRSLRTRLATLPPLHRHALHRWRRARAGVASLVAAASVRPAGPSLADLVRRIEALEADLADLRSRQSPSTTAEIVELVRRH